MRQPRVRDPRRRTLPAVDRAKVLLDENISPRVAEELARVVHLERQPVSFVTGPARRTVSDMRSPRRSLLVLLVLSLLGMGALASSGCSEDGHCGEDWSFEERSCTSRGGTWYCESANCVGARSTDSPPRAAPDASVEGLDSDSSDDARSDGADASDE